tara:strand:+ start:33268 stop:33507 length:240 start_codon:yes stop_codon:yes gene_type:complete
MNGRKNRNPDPNLFFANGQMIMKHPDNKSQKGQEINDWVFGQVDDDVLGGWSKYQGGAIKDKASYDTSDSINPQNYPDI